MLRDKNLFFEKMFKTNVKDVNDSSKHIYHVIHNTESLNRVLMKIENTIDGRFSSTNRAKIDKIVKRLDEIARNEFDDYDIYSLKKTMTKFHYNIVKKNTKLGDHRLAMYLYDRVNSTVHNSNYANFITPYDALEYMLEHRVNDIAIDKNGYIDIENSPTLTYFNDLYLKYDGDIAQKKDFVDRLKERYSICPTNDVRKIYRYIAQNIIEAESKVKHMKMNSIKFDS